MTAPSPPEVPPSPAPSLVPDLPAVPPPAAAGAVRPLVGVGWMLVTGLCFVAVTGLVRWLGTDLPAAQSAFVRFAFGILFLAPALAAVLRAGLPRRVLPLVAGRGAVHVAAVVLWFYAMARLPVAEVTAIGYLNPVLVTLGAALFLGERLAPRHLVALAVALAGTLIVLRPGLREIGPGHLAQIGAAACFAASYLFAKRLSAVFGPGAIVALMSATVTLGLLPFAVAVWVPPTVAQLGCLALVAAFASAAHYAMMRAFAAAPLSVTQPVTFLQIVWASILGTMVFGEPPDAAVILGGGTIVAAVSWLAWREAGARRRAAAGTAAAAA